MIHMESLGEEWGQAVLITHHFLLYIPQIVLLCYFLRKPFSDTRVKQRGYPLHPLTLDSCAHFILSITQFLITSFLYLFLLYLLIPLPKCNFYEGMWLLCSQICPRTSIKYDPVSLDQSDHKKATYLDHDRFVITSVGLSLSRWPWVFILGCSQR